MLFLPQFSCIIDQNLKLEETVLSKPGKKKKITDCVLHVTVLNKSMGTFFRK